MKLTHDDVVLFSGDSITDGNRGHRMDLNHIMGHGYQFIVAAKLALDNSQTMPQFINKGYSGNTMGQLFEKWQADVIDNRPTVLSILTGVNDGYFGYLNGKSIEGIVGCYKDSLTKAVTVTKEKLPATKIIICEPFYFPVSPEDYNQRIPHPQCEDPVPAFGPETDMKHVAYRVEATDKIRFAAKEVAEEYGCIFVPLYDRFKEEIAKSRAEYLIWDGTHPTIAGHMLMAEEWLKKVNEQ